MNKQSVTAKEKEKKDEELKEYGDSQHKMHSNPEIYGIHDVLSNSEKIRNLSERLRGNRPIELLTEQPPIQQPTHTIPIDTTNHDKEGSGWGGVIIWGFIIFAVLQFIFGHKTNRNPYEVGTGHYAGYEWAYENQPEKCGGNSQSFIEGCNAYKK